MSAAATPPAPERPLPTPTRESQPYWDGLREHKLVLPEGTRLTGGVVLAKKARHFHRAGQLRFNFQNVDLPQQAVSLRQAAPAPATLKTQAILGAAEASGKAPIQVDSEGGVKTKESKTRFIAPAISVVIASQAS